VQDGVRLLEISKTIFVQTAKFKRKRKLLNFVCSNLVWKDHTLTAVFRQPFDPLAIRIRLGKEKAAGADSSGLHNLWLPTLDNLRNFFLRRTEMVSFSNSYEKRTLETHNNGNYKADSVSWQSTTKRRRQNLSQK
jgi:hypothetical protein